MPSNCIHKLTFTHSLNDYGMTGYVVTRSVRMYNTQNYCNVVALMLLCNSHSERSHHNKGCVPSDKIVTKKFLYSFHSCKSLGYGQTQGKPNTTLIASNHHVYHQQFNNPLRHDLTRPSAPKHTQRMKIYIYLFFSLHLSNVKRREQKPHPLTFEQPQRENNNTLFPPYFYRTSTHTHSLRKSTFTTLLFVILLWYEYLYTFIYIYIKGYYFRQILCYPFFLQFSGKILW